MNDARFNNKIVLVVGTTVGIGQVFCQRSSDKQTNLILHLVRNIGKPKDVVEAILYLWSDDSSWVNTTILPIDSGMKVK